MVKFGVISGGICSIEIYYIWKKVLSGTVQVNSHTISRCCSLLHCATGCVPGLSGVEQVKSVSVQTLTLHFLFSGAFVAQFDIVGKSMRCCGFAL